MGTIVTLHRVAEIGQNTIGILRIQDMYHPPLWTCEDLWQDNRPNVSCIPDGSYTCVPHAWGTKEPFKFKRVWLVKNVPGRSGILIHAGNTHLDTLGCILVGRGISSTGVTDSQRAIDYLRDVIGQKSFTLIVNSDIIN